MHDDLGDLELVFMSGFGDYVKSPDFTRSEIFTRIAVGAKGPNYNEMRNPATLNFSEPRRLSIGVYAGRSFFPKDWSALPKLTNNSGADLRKAMYIIEEVNVGEEWINDDPKNWHGEGIGDWSNVGAWSRTGTDGSVLRPKFNDEKTTFYSARANQLRRDSSTEEEKDMSLVHEFIKKEKRKNRKFVLNKSLSSLDVITEDWHIESPVAAIVQPFMNTTYGIPIIGYSNLRCVLEELPTRDFSGLNGPNRKEGVEFILGSLLPYMQAWATSEK